jgi:hypothetical protein
VRARLMMRHARRASLLVAFSLLTSAVTVTAPAATVYAECAWVLWKQVTKNINTLVPLKPEGAYVSRDRCVSAAKLFVSGAPAYVEETGSDWTKHYDDGMILDYRCIPDTIDPSGPKGK